VMGGERWRSEATDGHDRWGEGAREDLHRPAC
jgi:hypothetical protein